LVDNGAYVLGIAKAKANPSTVAKRHAAFYQKVEVMAKEVPDVNLSAVVAFKAYIPAVVKDLERDFGATVDLSGARFIFAVNNKMLHLDKQVQVWIGNHQTQVKTATPFLCPVTGEVSTERVALHHAIRGVPNSGGAGASLISHDKAPFCSHRMDGSENAPMSLDGRSGYQSGLRHLLRFEEKTIEVMVEKTSKSGVVTKTREGKVVNFQPNAEKLADDTILVGWCLEKEMALRDLIDEDSRDPLEEARDEDVARSIRNGKLGRMLAGMDGEGTYNVLVLGGATGRVFVKGWRQATLREVCTNIDRIHNELRLNEHWRAPKLFEITKALSAQGHQIKEPTVDAKRMTSVIAQCYFGAASWPTSILPKLTQMMTHHLADKDPRFSTRVALMKATLIRKGQHITMSLDPGNKNIGYILGRLFYAYEKVHYEAYKEERMLNRSVLDKWAGAQTSPASTFSQLEKLSKDSYERRILRKNSKNMWAINEKTAVWDMLPASLPSRLTVDERACFSIGYHHAKQFDTNKRIENAKKKRMRDEEDADT
jgi:CRISPR-associated protein Csd1